MNEQLSILVIDDDKSIRKLMKDELSLRKFDVHLAKNGQAGVKLAKRKKPDVILLDWVMPGKDGLETLCDLKYNKHTKRIPVFMLTAKNKISDIDRAFDIGADDYITKPFDIIKMSGIIRQKLQKLEKARGEGVLV
jgi:DNA-binding response OmpR family regulator